MSLTGHTDSITGLSLNPDGTHLLSNAVDNSPTPDSRQIEYKLPGHLGSVNDAVFHPKEPIVASASSDKQIYLGELSRWS